MSAHLTMNLGGLDKFGPDVQLVESIQDFAVDALSSIDFYVKMAKYCPTPVDGALLAGYAGILPKISDSGESACRSMIQGSFLQA